MSATLGVLALLYLFLTALTTMGTSFKVMTGRSTGALFGGIVSLASVTCGKTTRSRLAASLHTHLHNIAEQPCGRSAGRRVGHSAAAILFYHHLHHSVTGWKWGNASTNSHSSGTPFPDQQPQNGATAMQ